MPYMVDRKKEPLEFVVKEEVASMARSENFGQLVKDEQDAFMRKQAAYQAYQVVKEKADQLYKAQQDTWKELCRVKKIMNQEFEALQAARVQTDAVWKEYKRIRDYNNQRISMLKPQADEMYRRMSVAFEAASNAYNFGSKADAAAYSAEGRSYQEQLKYLNSEIRSLAQAVTDAKQSAQSHGSPASNSAFRSAQEEYRRAKVAHLTAQDAFNCAKSERERLFCEFQNLQQQYLSKRDAVQGAKNKRQEEQKTKENQRQDLMSSAGVPLYYQEDCKVVIELNGTVNFYFGGLGENDGLWHGHISMDRAGHVTYIRMPVEEHGAEHFTSDPALNDFTQPIDQGKKWGQVFRGWIDDGTTLQAATVQEGIEGTDREGHTLIADGFVADAEFTKYRRKPEEKNHNHYGPNVIPGRLGRVEDAENGGDRGKYTGPGK